MAAISYSLLMKLVPLRILVIGKILVVLYLSSLIGLSPTRGVLLNLPSSEIYHLSKLLVT